MAFKKGDKVQQKITPFVGEITGFGVDQETGAVLVHVEQLEGDHSARYFREDELESAGDA